MTFISLAQATRRLGIDGKTLHRWLAQAQLSVYPHPTDGRQKGLSLEQLHTLATRHQRQLAPLSAESSLRADTALPPSPALLAVSEHLAALETQLAVLRAEVAELTRFLQQHPAVPTPPTPPRQPPVKAPSPPRRAAASTSAPKAPRKPVHVIPRVEYAGDGRYVVICPKKGRLAMEVESPEWFDWVRIQSSFRFVGKSGHFSAHHEWRTPRGAWRAHRKIRNHTHIQRLAPSQDLTIAVLEQAAAALQAHLS